MTSWAAQQRKQRIAKALADAKAREARAKEREYATKPGYQVGTLREIWAAAAEKERFEEAVIAKARIEAATARAEEAQRAEFRRLSAEHRVWMNHLAAKAKAKQQKQQPARQQRPAARRSRGEVETRTFDGGTWRLK